MSEAAIPYDRQAGPPEPKYGEEHNKNSVFGTYLGDGVYVDTTLDPGAIELTLKGATITLESEVLTKLLSFLSDEFDLCIHHKEPK